MKKNGILIVIAVLLFIIAIILLMILKNQKDDANSSSNSNEVINKNICKSIFGEEACSTLDDNEFRKYACSQAICCELVDENTGKALCYYCDGEDDLECNKQVVCDVNLE